MNIRKLNGVRKRLEEFVEEFRPILGRSERRHWCAMYLCGLMLDGERKSIEPISKRIPGGNEQALQQFVNQSPWNHKPVLEKLFDVMMSELKPQRGILILDDTSLPKICFQPCRRYGAKKDCRLRAPAPDYRAGVSAIKKGIGAGSF